MICARLLLASCVATAGCAGGVDGGKGLVVNPASVTARALTLKTAVAGKYVSAEGGGGGPVDANRDVASSWETFTLEDLDGGQLADGDLVHLAASTGQYVCAENGGGGLVDANRAVASAWETFRVVKLSGGDRVVRDGDAIALQTYLQGRYLSAINGGGDTVVADRTAIQAWETFLVGGGTAQPPPQSQWQLTFSDEFDGGWGPVDGGKWAFDTGGNGWGNHELEYYTDRTDNAVVDGNGSLSIIARAESYGGRGYTSARLNSAGRFSQAYGRFEARIQLPSGRGLWPAFWTLGENIGSVGWPGCGELDIMEVVTDFSINHGSAHGPGYSGANSLTASYRTPSGSLSDGFHVYAMEWEPAEVRWYVDGNLYERRTPADLPPGARWVYDHPFFIILNLAVGGDWPGAPDGSTPFPQTMRVDYVRVYKKL